MSFVPYVINFNDVPYEDNQFSERTRVHREPVNRRVAAAMDQETTMFIKKEEVNEGANEPDSMFLEDPPGVSWSTVYIKAPEIKLEVDEAENIFLEDPSGISWSTEYVKAPELNLEVDEAENIVVTPTGYVPCSTRLIKIGSESRYISPEEAVKQEVVPSDSEMGAEESKHFTMLAIRTGGGEEDRSLPDTRLKCYLSEKEFHEFSCSFCLQRFPSKYGLIMHVFIHIDGVQPPTYVCNSCGEVFASNTSFKKHLKINGSAGTVAEQQTATRVRSIVHRERSVRDRFVALVEGEGCSIREAGRRCGVPNTTALRWWRRYRERGSTSRAAGSGRRRVSSRQQDSELVSVSRRRPFLDAKQLLRETRFPGSSDTVRRRLREAGLRTLRSAVK